MNTRFSASPSRSQAVVSFGLNTTNGTANAAAAGEPLPGFVRLTPEIVTSPHTFYLSYHPQDSSTARALAESLKQEGLTVLLRDFSARQKPLDEATTWAMANSRHTLILLSTNYLTDPMTGHEQYKALERTVQTGGLQGKRNGSFVFPIYIENCQPEGPIGKMDRIRMFGPDSLRATELLKLARSLKALQN
jgi:hypothetical protein